MQDSLDLAKLQARQCNLPHESQTTKMLAILVTVYVTALIAIGLRLIAKSFAKIWSTDDALIVAAIVIAIAPFSLVIIMATMGFGTHLYDLQSGQLTKILQLLYAAEIVYVFVLLFAKLSLVTFYLRIFTVPRFRMAAYSLIAFLVLGQVIIGFLTIFSCHPIELFWNKDIHTGGCLDINQLAYANSALAILQDLIILALPIAMLPGLQMNKNKKISVAVIFLLGSVGFISTIIRLQVLAVFGNSIDPTWDYVPVVWWTTIELGVVIVCACLPMIRNLVEKWFPNFKLFKWSSPKPSKDSVGSSSVGTDDKSYKMGRYQKFGRSTSPPQFSDNYVRDHIGGPPSKTDEISPTKYRDMYAYGGYKPKVLEDPMSPPQPYDLSWRSTNPYGISGENPYAVGKTNYRLNIEMLERKDRNFDEELPDIPEHPEQTEVEYYGRCCEQQLCEQQQKHTCSTCGNSKPQVPMPAALPQCLPQEWTTWTTDDGVDASTRAYWMRQANLALPNLCPFAAFGAVVVNHTAGGLGELVCTGANNNQGSGNPTLHGEMVAINNCSAIFTDPQGRYNMTPADALLAFGDLTLYTNAESCPMCASAIRWAGFKEYVYGTNIDALVDMGWGQITVSSKEIFNQSSSLSSETGFLGDVLTNETDGFFSWQFRPNATCPQGCSRAASGRCAPA
ncbi:Satratoxin biosynthesis SC1 cluster protein 4 [Colletotrichum fructicola]|nr:Satratoxin biosynthesis SC1 cluster protein 4 [Colletotrichum fructicola]